MPGIIHLLDGDKGGIGKSFVAMTLIQYFLDNSREFVAVEADRYNPDVANRYRDLNFRFATFSEDEQVSSANDNENPDQIIDIAALSDVIVSLPAQVGIPLKTWIDTALIACEETGSSFVRWFVTSGTYESLNLFKIALKRHGKSMPFVLVKNWGMSDDWSEIEAFDGLLNLVDKYQVKAIDFPKLTWKEANLIQKHNWRFSEARSAKDLHLMQRTRIKTFLSEAYSAFESTGLLSDE